MPLGDVLQMLQLVGSLDAQRNQQLLASRQQAQGAYGDFTKIIGAIRDPGQRTAFINSYAQQTGVDPNALAQIAQNTEPTVASNNAEVQADYIAGLQHPDVAAAQTPGYQQYTQGVATQMGQGMGVGEAAHQAASQAVFQHLLDGSMKGTPFGDALTQEFQARTAAGMGAGDAMVDTMASNLPSPELTRAAGVKLGTRLSAAEQQSGELQRGLQQFEAAKSAAELNLEDRKLAQEGIVGLAAINQRAQAAQLRQSAIDDAKKRLMNNLQFLSKNATTSAAGSIMLKSIQDDYDLLYGPGSFAKVYSENHDMSPSTIQKIMVRMGM